VCWNSGLYMWQGGRKQGWRKLGPRLTWAVGCHRREGDDGTADACGYFVLRASRSGCNGWTRSSSFAMLIVSCLGNTSWRVSYLRSSSLIALVSEIPGLSEGKVRVSPNVLRCECDERWCEGCLIDVICVDVWNWLNGLVASGGRYEWLPEALISLNT